MDTATAILTTEYYYEEDESGDGLFWFANILIILTGAVTILGNPLTIAAFAQNKALRRPGNSFLVSLAVADLWAGVICFLMMVDLGECNPLMISFFDALTYLPIYTSLLHLVLIATDRFMLVNNPTTYTSKMTRKTANTVISLTWLAMFLLSGLPLIKYATTDFECEGVLSDDLWRITNLVIYFITMPTIAIIYGRILLLVKRQPSRITDIENTILTPGLSYASTGFSNLDDVNASNMAIENPNDQKMERIAKKIAQRRKKSLVILFILILATFILWTPSMIYELLVLIGAVNPEDHFEGEVEYLLLTFGLVNSAVNTFVYASVSTEFRKEYGRIFRCERCCNNKKQSRNMDSDDVVTQMELSSTAF